MSFFDLRKGALLIIIPLHDGAGLVRFIHLSQSPFGNAKCPQQAVHRFSRFRMRVDFLDRTEGAPFHGARVEFAVRAVYGPGIRNTSGNDPGWRATDLGEFRTPTRIALTNSIRHLCRPAVQTDPASGSRNTRFSTGRFAAWVNPEARFAGSVIR
jgi:hypothetical protein